MISIRMFTTGHTEELIRDVAPTKAGNYN